MATKKILTNIDSDGTIKSTGFIKTGGTASQFLKADGSIDSTAYGTGTVAGTGTAGTLAKFAAGGTNVEDSTFKESSTKALIEKDEIIFGTDVVEIDRVKLVMTPTVLTIFPGDTAKKTALVHELNEITTYFGENGLGIAVADPDAPLHIYENLDEEPTKVIIENGDTTITSGQQVTALDFQANDSSTNGSGIMGQLAMVAENAGTIYGMALYTKDGTSGVNEVMRLSGDGNVGIGTDDPSDSLVVRNGTSNSKIKILSHNSAAGTEASLEFSTIASENGYEKAAIIAKNAAGSFGRSNMHFALDSAADSSGVQYSDTKMTILNGGNVGIGTIDPSTKLEVDGNILTSGGVSNENDGVRVTNPGGGAFATQTSSTTGAIKIVLPQESPNTMLRMTVKVYEYVTNESFILNCGGYATGSNVWVNEFAYIENSGVVDRNFTVRFGNDGNNACIYVGELNSTWSYIQVFVTDFQAGYQNATAALWQDGWDIQFETTAFDSVTRTVTNTQTNNWVRDGINTYSAATGNVGIGTTSPSDKLEVAAANSQLRLTDTDDGKFTQFSYSSGKLIVRNNSTTTHSNQFTLDAAGKMGIGTADPQEKLHVQNYTTGESHQAMFKGGAVTTGDYSYISLNNGYSTDYNKEVRLASVSESANSNATGFAIFTSPDANGAGGHERLRVKSNGNVGIGTTSPDSISGTVSTLSLGGTNAGTSGGITFQVNGTVKAYNYVTSDYLINQTVAGVGQIFYGAGLERMRIDKTGGNVSIGTTGVGHTKLHVHGGSDSAPTLGATGNGSFAVTGGQTSYGFTMGVYGNGKSYIQSQRFDSNTTVYDLLLQPVGGRVLIGTKHLFETDGDAHHDGDVIAYSTSVSDRRRKDNIKTIDNATETVKQLRGVSYEWNKGHRKGQKEIGVIAQEVEEVLPFLVREKTLLDGDSVKTVDYEKIIGLLIEDSKSKDARIEKLETMVELILKDK